MPPDSDEKVDWLVVSVVSPLGVVAAMVLSFNQWNNTLPHSDDWVSWTVFLSLFCHNIIIQHHLTQDAIIVIMVVVIWHCEWSSLN